MQINEKKPKLKTTKAKGKLKDKKKDDKVVFSIRRATSPAYLDV